MTGGQAETPEERALIVPVTWQLMMDLEILGKSVGRVPGVYAREVLRQHVYGKELELRMLKGSGHQATPICGLDLS